MIIRYCATIAMLALLISCGGSPSASSGDRSVSEVSTAPASIEAPIPASAFIEKERQWYEGGDLHRASIGQWKVAAFRNKLATSADMVASLKKFSSMEEMKSAAVDLEQCISKVAEGAEAERQGVSDVAAACALLLGYQANDHHAG
jgi:hypothetical protein